LEESSLGADQFYGNRVRLRVCGIYIEDDKLLLVNHSLYGSETQFWSPPGGGVDFGESAMDALKREFREETGLLVEVGEMLFVNEFIKPPLHAVEIFFKITSATGSLLKGIDPEFDKDSQIITEVKFMSLPELRTLPDEFMHSQLKNINSFSDLFQVRGFLI